MENTEKSIRDIEKKYEKILNYRYQQPENVRESKNFPT